MARRGRKRKLVHREGNGRAKRSLRPVEDVRQFVMNQPHRRGSTSERLASPVGRLLEGNPNLAAKLSVAGLYDAANRFGDAYQKWQSVVGSRRPLSNSLAGVGGELTADMAERFKARWSDAWSALRQAGPAAEKAVFAAVIDPQAETWQPAGWVCYWCIEGLKALADHFGIDIKDEDKAAPGRAA